MVAISVTLISETTKRKRNRKKKKEKKTGRKGKQGEGQRKATLVIPAKAGIQWNIPLWIPVFTGMTKSRSGMRKKVVLASPEGARQSSG
jgi:hypothetical protein